MTTPLPLTTLHFPIPLRPSGISSFRGMVAELTGWEHDAFHNHADGEADKYHYRFPLIQYKIRRYKAAILGMGAGATMLRSFIDSDGLLFAGKFPIEERQDKNFQVGMSPTLLHYRIENWLPLNQQNYENWQVLKDEEDIALRQKELERILTAHLLAFAAGIGFTVPRPRGLEVKLHRFYGPNQVKTHHRTPLEAYDVRFSANMLLPNGVGIGKSSSIGFGNIWTAKATGHDNHPTPTGEQEVL